MMRSMTERDLKAAMRARGVAFERFNVWQSTHPSRLSSQAALEAIGALYELLPPASRQRPIDPAGVITFHEILRRLGR
jgi:hypothetical protein